VLATTTTDPIQDIIAAGVLITAIYGAVNARQNRKITKQNDDQAGKLDTAADKLDSVHDLVNSQLSDAVDRKDVAEARTKVLEDEAKGD
jgi:hypothetical protein